jgi:predicted alpha/beta hydrolase family esterase
MNKTLVFYIHGGTTFKSKKEYLDFLKNRKVSLDEKVKWSELYLDEKLGSSFHVVRPRMPLQENATYEEWKLTFESYLPLMKVYEKVVLIGVSLGGIFLAKYLTEQNLRKKVLATFLI